MAVLKPRAALRTRPFVVLLLAGSLLQSLAVRAVGASDGGLVVEPALAARAVSGASALARCQRAIRRSAGDFVGRKLRTLETCGSALMTCVQTRAADPKCDQRAVRACGGLRKLDGLAARLQHTVAKACAAVSAPAMLDDPGLGYGGIADQCSAEFHLPTTDAATIAACIVRQHACRADALFALQLPRATELLVAAGIQTPPGSLECLTDYAGPRSGDVGHAKAIEKCARAIRRSGIGFATARLHGLDACVARVLACDNVKPERQAACRAKAGAACADGGRRLERATKPKVAAAITKACGQLDFASVLGAPTGVNLSALGAECARVGVPSVAPLSEYIACLFRQHECAANDLLVFEVPRAQRLLDAVGQDALLERTFCAAAVATPIVEPTATPTPEETATPSETATPAASDTVTPGATATATDTPVVPTPTSEPTALATASATATANDGATPGPPTVTPDAATPSPTSTPTPVATGTSTATATDSTPTPTPTIAATATPAVTATSTPTATPVVTPTATPTSPCGNRVIDPGEQCDDGNVANADGCSATCERELLDPAPENGEHFGWALALAGADVLLGAPLHDEVGANNVGIAYLVDPTTGAARRTFRHPAPIAGAELGWSLAAVGTTVAVGAPFDPTAGPDAGAVYVFERATGASIRTFLDPAPGVSDHFGWTVTPAGPDLLVTAPLDDDGEDGGGAAYLYDGETGALRHVFLSPTPAAGDEFGWAVAVVGSTLAIGVPRHDVTPGGGGTPVADAGVVHLFDLATGAFLRTLSAATPTAGALFGRSLAASDGRVLVGAPHASGDAGAAYLFDAATGALLQTFANPTPAGDDAFGHAVAFLAATKVLVGAPDDDTYGLNAGAVYVFHAASGTLLGTLRKAAPAPDDELGRALATLDGRALVAAPFDDAGAPDTGAAYVLADRSCGNGALDPGEACDDGNLTDGDGCDANCTPTGCGNGVVTAGEACDDGNQIAGDGCDASCAAEGRCGDGVRQGAEACDDGNDVDGDGCDGNCTATGCGNGVVTAGEACDDGAGNGGDGCCTAGCQLVDADGDGTCDRDDVCPAVADPTQHDRDRDGTGDACDRCPDDLVDDADGDGFCLGAAFAAPALGGSDPCSRLGGTTLTTASASFTSLNQGAGSQHMHLKGRIAVGAPVPRIAPDRYGIHVRVTDRNGALVVDEHLPGVLISDATKQGWRAVGNPPAKWVWADNNSPAGHNGIDAVTVQAVNGVPDAYDVDISSQTGTFGLTPGREPVTVGVALNDGAVPSGRTPGRDQCGEIAFAVSPATPNCRFTSGNNILTCD